MYKHLLVPIDGSPLASITVEQAVRFARDAAARITFLHVQRDYASSGNGSLLYSMAPLDFEYIASGDSCAWLGRAASAASAAKVDYETVMVVSGRIHETIHEVALLRGCDLIYMSSHGRRNWWHRPFNSVTGKLLDTTTVPVLVVRVEANAALTAEQRALTVILDDHRSIAAVIRVMMQVTGKGMEDHETHFKLLHAALFYLDAFPERQHHPKEEQTLFRMLRSRWPEGAEVLGELERQHRDGSSDLDRLRDALAAYEASGADARERFEQALQRFAETQWAHMDLEEETVLPAASTHLTANDWEAVASAFEHAANPHADSDAEAAFARVFKRLMDLAANVTTVDQVQN